MNKPVLLFILLLASTVTDAQWTDGQAADRVLGQPDLTSNTANNGGISAMTLNGCSAIAIDVANGKMYIADEQNHRILRYAYPITSDQQAADLVFGQADFTSSSPNTTQNTFNSPRGIAVDNTGRLWVGDGINSRVVWFNAAHTLSSNQPNADGVLGQLDFTSTTSARTQSGMSSNVEAVSIDNSGTLWVVDRVNHRALRFDNAASKANGANADGVLGQADFTSSSVIVTQNRMFNPFGAFIDDNGTLWVADRGNNRVLRFDNAASKANGANTDGVLGQADFTSKSFATTQSEINQPINVAVDGDGRLYVAEVNNNRVLIFDNAASKANGANADNVLGQADFTSSGASTIASTMNGGFRSSIAIDGTNNLLWVSDTDNNRAIRFTASSNLPVELVYFKGKTTDQGNHLTWQTASELNNEGFEIERSTTGLDWQAIGFVKGSGTTQSAQDYTFMDTELFSGTSYYRLKQVDFDGRYEYSRVVGVSRNEFGTGDDSTASSRDFGKVRVFPNPVKDELTIMEGQGIATLYNILGQPVMQLAVSPDASGFVVSTVDLPQGQYILHITRQNGSVVTKQFMKN